MNLLKKHISDVLIFLGVLAVFFLTGTPKKKSNDSIQSIESLLQMQNTIVVVEPQGNIPLPVAPGTSISKPINLDSKPVNQNNLPAPDSQPANPYAVLMNRGNPNVGKDNPNIQNSLNNLRGEAPSTEALIERNTYFKKLSEQLKDLQGNVNTDEEKPKEAGKVSEQDKIVDELSDPDNEENEIDELTEPELDENFPPPDSQQ